MDKGSTGVLRLKQVLGDTTYIVYIKERGLADLIYVTI